MTDEGGLARRVAMLEETVNSLKRLPQRLDAVEHRLAVVEGRLEVVDGRLDVVDYRLGAVESQIVHLRTEMHDEFSAIHRELATKPSKEDLARFATKEDLSRELHEALAEVGGWILASEERTNRHMRVMYEDLLARIATLGEGR